jgi:hypothetical protein
MRLMRADMTLALALGLALVTLNACGGQPPAATPRITEPAPTEEPTNEPESTPVNEPSTPASPAPTGASDSGNDWPATVTADLNPGIYVNEFANGSFTSSGPATACGNAFPSLFPRGWDMYFPHDSAHHDIEDVTFSADDLVPGTSTSSFYISVSIDTPSAGSPPATVIDAKNPESSSGGTGLAQVSESDGTRTLVVDATGKGDVSIHLTAVCTRP